MLRSKSIRSRGFFRWSGYRW